MRLRREQITLTTNQSATVLSRPYSEIETDDMLYAAMLPLQTNLKVQSDATPARERGSMSMPSWE